ncbi:maleylpyruvate isomerase N-terminal domain-containing protein [Kribbella karoonensis]|jgi:hypothetical protein|uniref:Mycothiol-dependent maleylpyruvate isomerase metal-binding domain-containing protein n=1 Tax=Kribbella karoonensis TaxID=324851 RepID=A0ABN2D0J6_9ACTN|nr:maleylpyruvate isomerase N-terminal domain-containing protein [Kribbella sp.]
MAALHEQLAAAAREAIRLADGVDPGQLDDPTPCPAYDVRALIAHLMQEIVLHSWDLAVATGQQPEFPDEVAETVLRWLEGGGEDLTSGEWYAAPVPTGADSPLARAVALSGRDARGGQ